jgi:two-component system response regulator RpaA
MTKRKDILTTGQVAQICKVAPRTVTKWFDSGQLKGYRIPGSRDRRIPASELLRFMKANNIPTDMLDVGKLRVMIIDSDWEISSGLAQALKSRGNYETQTAQSSFDAGVVAQKFVPHVVLIDLLAKDIDAGAICKNIRSNEDLQAVKVVVLADHLSQSETIALMKKGFDAVLPKDADITETIKKIEEVTAIIY